MNEKKAFDLFCLTGDINYYLIYKKYAAQEQGRAEE